MFINSIGIIAIYEHLLFWNCKNNGGIKQMIEIILLDILLKDELITREEYQETVKEIKKQKLVLFQI